MIVIKYKKITVLSDITSFLDKPHLYKAKINQFFIWNERRWPARWCMVLFTTICVKVNIKYLIIQLGLFRIIYLALQFG